MTENVENTILEFLENIQADAAAFRAETNGRFERIDQRFERLEDLARKQRRDTAGMLVMAKAVAGDFAEQVAAIEERVAVLEARTS